MVCGSNKWGRYTALSESGAWVPHSIHWFVGSIFQASNPPLGLKLRISPIFFAVLSLSLCQLSGTNLESQESLEDFGHKL